VLMREFMQRYFGSSPLSWETLGTPETIRALTVEQMREYWRIRYGTENMVFAVAGNFDWDSIVAQVGTLTADWERGVSGRATARAPFTPSSTFIQRDTFAQEQITIGVPSIDRSDERTYVAHVLATILGDDTGSRLFWALHDTGLAESASAQVMPFEDDGVFLVYLATDPAHLDEVLDRTQAELRRVQEFDIQEDELERAKAKLISSVVIGGESNNSRAMALIHSWLDHGRLDTLEDVRRKIEAVSLTDLEALVQEYPLWPNQVLTALGPVSGPQAGN
jgi:predicted Zn-dependent peptidase